VYLSRVPTDTLLCTNYLLCLNAFHLTDFFDIWLITNIPAFQNNKNGLPDECSKMEIISSFGIKYVRLSLMFFFSNSGYEISIIMHLNIAYWKCNGMMFNVLMGFVWRRSVTSAILKGLVNSHVNLSHTTPLSPMKGTGISWTNESALQSVPVYM